jgi:tRNA (guanine37-N1)-methyltransferase
VRFDIITLFPEMIWGAVRHGVTGRAIDRGIVEVRLWNPREFTHDRYRTVDDRPYGGGPGMVMKVEPLRDSIRAAHADSSLPAKTICMSPQGQLLNQKAMLQLAAHPRLILVAGRYEGIDERLMETEIDEEWSIGDYVLSGGELAAMVLLDGIVRLLPGVLGHTESAAQDSHVEGLLDCPHYTRPEVVDGRRVPDILQSGNHAAIERWRLKQSLGRTWLRRPDLLEKLQLNPVQKELLEEFQSELKAENTR